MNRWKVCARCRYATISDSNCYRHYKSSRHHKNRRIPEYTEEEKEEIITENCDRLAELTLRKQYRKNNGIKGEQ